MRRIAALLLVLSAIAPSAFAAWGKQEYFHDATAAEREMKSVALAPGASAAILELMQRQDDEASYMTEYVRMKIFGEEGKKYGDIELYYIPHFTGVKDIKARTIHADGSVVNFEGKMYDKLIVKAGGVRVMARTFSIPDIQPGSIVEYQYTRTWPFDYLSAASHWVLQRDIPVLKYNLWIKPYNKHYSSFFISHSTPGNATPKQTGDHFEMALENIPAFDKEPYALPDQQLKARVDLYYTLGKTDPTEFWTEEGKEWAKIVEDFIGDRSGIRKAAQQLTAGAAAPEEKLRKVYAKVQSLRNTSFDDDKTVQESSREKLRDNRHIEDVLEHGYGGRSELTRLFVGLARGAGLDASVARVATRDDIFFSRQFPVGSQLDAEVAVVNVDGKPRYFDPGTPFAPFGVLSWEKTDVAGLQLARKSGGTWITTPLSGLADGLTKRTADLRLDGDVLKGKITLTWTGQPALERRLEHQHDDEAATKKALEEEAKKLFPDGSTVKLAKIDGIKAGDEPLVAAFDVELANLGTVTGSRALLPLSVFAASRKNPFAAEQRKSHLYWAYPYQNEDEVTVKLPEGYAVESMPTNADINLGAVKYASQWEKTSDALRFRRTMTIDTVFVEVGKYPVLRTFYSKVATADQETAVLRKAGK
jgi:hypothetical protein